MSWINTFCLSNKKVHEYDQHFARLPITTMPHNLNHLYKYTSTDEYTSVHGSIQVRDLQQQSQHNNRLLTISINKPADSICATVDFALFIRSDVRARLTIKNTG